MQPWLEMLEFIMSTLPSINVLAIPITLNSNADMMLRSQCKLKVWHTERVELGPEDLVSFYQKQSSIRELSVVHLDVEEHPDVVGLLPHLESIGGTTDMILTYAPGHPITKVCLS